MQLPRDFQSRAPIRAKFQPLIDAYLRAGGVVLKFNPRGLRVA